jgi:NIPSNAP
MAFYELRQYVIKPGKMAEWLHLMETEIIPFQVAKGMVITGSYRGESDDSVYVWTRRFDSEAERVALYAAVYESEHWKTNLSPRVGELIDRPSIQVQRLLPTKLSPVQ